MDKNTPHTPLSGKMKKAAENLKDEGMTLEDIFALKGAGAALGGLLTLLSIPALLPSTGVPIGTTMSIGMFAVALAMLLGAEEIRLPRKVGSFKLSTGATRHLLNGLSKLYHFMEKWAQPRLEFLTSRVAQRWLSIKVFVMAFIIFLPIPLPFANTLPALALLILGPALIYRDGLAVLASFAMGAIAIGFTAAVFYGGLWAATQIL